MASPDDRNLAAREAAEAAARLSVRLFSTDEIARLGACAAALERALGGPEAKVSACLDMLCGGRIVIFLPVHDVDVAALDAVRADPAFRPLLSGEIYSSKEGGGSYGYYEGRPHVRLPLRFA